VRAFIFEPNAHRRRILEREIAVVGLAANFVQEEFFNNSLSLLRQSGAKERAVLIADTPRTKSIVRDIRRAGCKNPIIALCETKEPGRVAELLNSGADDVVVSPLSGTELVSRIASIVRRYNGHVAESVTIGEITVYFDGRDPLISGNTIALSKREYDIFCHLALKADKLISKNSIYDAIYSMSVDQPFDKVIDVYICKLRKKITKAAASGFPYIQTVRGRGYKLIAPENLPSQV